ncbi:MAG: sulfotransferase family protein [Egibacteraceae bacterium]
MRVVGAGLGRTGTYSLKLALEQLTGGRCYHMAEVIENPGHIAVWRAALHGAPPDWPAFLAEYDATVDWPGAGFWHELAAAFPEAVVLLSRRQDAETWWKSANRTIFEVGRSGPPEGMDEWFDWVLQLFDRFTPHWSEPRAAMAAYEAHNAAIRAAIAPHRLVEWQPEDGWGPLCEALGAPFPDTPFPHHNSTAEFRTRAGWD